MIKLYFDFDPLNFVTKMYCLTWFIRLGKKRGKKKKLGFIYIYPLGNGFFSLLDYQSSFLIQVKCHYGFSIQTLYLFDNIVQAYMRLVCVSHDCLQIDLNMRCVMLYNNVIEMGITISHREMKEVLIFLEA